MEQRKENMQSLGFPKGFDANKFIGRENYKRRLHEKINNDLCFLRIDISPNTFMDFIKPVRTLNGVSEAIVL